MSDALTEICFSVEQRHQYGHVVEWTNRHSTHECGAESDMDNQARHQRIGSWREKDTKPDAPGCDPGPVRSDPVLVPWVTLEVNEGDLVERFERTGRLLKTLEEHGARLDEGHVTFSGNKSFHVRIPIGQFGSVVFESADKARQVISEWADLYIAQSLDRELFDPFHLVRTPGSRHEESGRYANTYTASEFREIGLETVVQHSKEHRPHRFENPTHVAPSGLADTLRKAGERAEKEIIPGPDEITLQDDTTQGGSVLERIKGGVSKGQSFSGANGSFHQGRNKATFIYACLMLDRHDTNTAKRKTERYAQRHNPPLGEHPEDQRKEWAKCFDSALRTV